MERVNNNFSVPEAEYGDGGWLEDNLLGLSATICEALDASDGNNVIARKIVIEFNDDGSTKSVDINYDVETVDS